MSVTGRRPALRLGLGLSRRAWASFLAFITVGPATVALVFTLWPGLRPDPADRLSAEMRAITVDPHVTFGEFLRSIDERPSPQARATVRATGAVVYVKVSVHGRKHHDLDLYSSLYHARGPVRFADGSVNRVRASYFRADTPDDQWVATVWVPSPPAFDRVFVRLELYDRHSMLAVADSPAFRFARPSLAGG